MAPDVLVVGSGGAGLSAALAAARAGARVLLVTKLGLASSNTAKAQGGIQAAVGEDDAPELHEADVYSSSHETADRRLSTVLAAEAPDVVRRLEELGVAFTRTAEGGYRLARCGGASRRRLLQVGDRTGHVIAAALRDAVRAHERIETLDHTALVGLDPDGGRIRAEIDERGSRRTVEAGAVVLAAGGRCYAEARRRGEASTNGAGATGEVTEIAVGVGCAVRDIDALQWHPNGGAWPESMAGYSIPETTRAYGALLLNGRGERFVDELAPRDVVAAAIVREVAEGRGVGTPDGRPSVLLDVRPVPAADAEISLPYMLRRYRHAGIDPLREPIHTYPVLHYQNGGLVIDPDGATTVDGVWAAGEITGGVHGRNRMMGNSLLDICVFGRRAGRAAAAAVVRVGR
ncbi:MAG: L-aspartate oxidase [uncultured Thermoleophilia bacterium]|uniref:L-aspartate oxidase n=1 Tax=uncultured Thermoleophilia bacterium TaxID=1497501 RepID=A0A6J4UKP2_9ACTN|nr:MAG: L-aspartate oxidase [uncultured Thermoleophilia bacterium]